MKLNTIIFSSVVALFAIQTQTVTAQETRSRHEKWEIGLQAGAFQGQNDLNNLGTEEINPGGGLLLRYHLDDNFALRANALYGEITGDDVHTDRNKLRGFTFSTPVYEGSLMAEVDLLGKQRYASNNKFRRMLSPYGFAGIGYALIQPQTDYNEINNPDIIDQINVDKNKTIDGTMILPMGIGAKLDLSEEWVLGVEMGLRVTFNDYFDGVSVAGNSRKNDTYAIAAATVSYRFPYLSDRDHDGVADFEDACPEVKGDKKTQGCPDSDGDGLTDNADGCPNEIGSKATNGCPDSDGDGLGDKSDICPNEKGSKNTGGCPDRDNDAIADKNDACPDAPGPYKNGGCPDTDGDGILDKDDKCPDQKGTAELMGCPANDRDRDGVLDEADACPDEAGKASLKGCPDADNDGLANNKDKCPDVAGTIANEGCPELSVADKKIIEDAIYGVQFESGKSIIKKTSNPILDQVASVMERYPAYNLTISGHTDNAGSDAANQRLSEARAKACYDYLVAKGIAAARMTHQGFGESKPVTDNTTPEGRAKNRRVEFALKVK